MSAREEIITTLRGRYAVPVISVLAKAGIIEKLLVEPQNIERLGAVKNKQALCAMLTYLSSLGFLLQEKDSFSITPLGRTVLLRAGAAHILESYAQYFSNLEDILQSPDTKKYSVDRSLNILGSGSLHECKFFNPALDMIVGNSGFHSLIDLGCGDGSFLAMAAMKLSPQKSILAVDLSAETASTTLHRLHSLNTSAKIDKITCSAEDVEVWSKAISVAEGRELISAWFVIHEFCENDVARTVEFFKKIHTLRPRAELIIGEVISANSDVLAANKNATIMP
jgi:hypothetical protein